MIGDTEKGYDLTALEQTKATIDSIKDSPGDQQILEMFAAKLGPSAGLLCDLGCGPGQIARYFHERGFRTVGIDLSAGMLQQARQFNPDIRFVKANMKKLPFEDGELAAIVGYHSLCHVPRPQVPLTLDEMWRTLRPSGLLLLAFHLGRGTFLRTESWGKPVTLQTTMFQSLELQDYLRTAGFRIDGSTENLSTTGARGFIWGHKPGDDLDAARALREAVLIGSAEDVESIISRGLSPDTKVDGFAPLHFAAGDGRLRLIKLLLRAGATVDMPCWGGGTALSIAVQMGQLHSARHLAEAGGDPAKSDDIGNTPLHLACHIGRTDIAKWLLQLGVDPQPKNEKAETPATWASRAGFGPLAKLLKAAGGKGTKRR